MNKAGNSTYSTYSYAPKEHMHEAIAHALDLMIRRSHGFPVGWPSSKPRCKVLRRCAKTIKMVRSTAGIAEAALATWHKYKRGVYEAIPTADADIWILAVTCHAIDRLANDQTLTGAEIEDIGDTQLNLAAAAALDPLAIAGAVLKAAEKRTFDPHATAGPKVRKRKGTVLRSV